jgi:hypothetical protein
VCAVGEILVYEGTWVGVACRWNWPQAGHVLAQLCDEVRWFHWVCVKGQVHRGSLKVLHTRARLLTLVDPL